MNGQAYRYRFRDRDVFEKAVRVTYQQALLAVVGLFGQARVRMDAAHAVDELINVLVIDAGSPVGLALCMIFTTFLSATYGHEAFDVQRVDTFGTYIGSEVRK